jgi:hypothetical protein
MKAVGMIVRFGSVVLLLAAGLAQSSSAPFSIMIAAAHTEMKSGSEVKVNVTVTNISNRDIGIKMTSPLCDYVVEVRDSAARLAPDTEQKRAQYCGADRTTGRDFVAQLKPNESVRDSIPVSALSDMSQPGEYSVQVMRKTPKDMGGVVVKSNTITINVTR